MLFLAGSVCAFLAATGLTTGDTCVEALAVFLLALAFLAVAAFSLMSGET